MQETTPWPDGPVRRASVNSFGYGGANAHTILDSIDVIAPGHGGTRRRARTTARREKTKYLPNGYPNGVANDDIETFADVRCSRLMTAHRKFLLPLSAHKERTLKKYIETLSLCADQWSLLDLSHTLGCHRSTFSNRSFVIAKAGQVELKLQSKDISVHKTLGSTNASLGFVFTGMTFSLSAGTIANLKQGKVPSGRRWVLI